MASYKVYLPPNNSTWGVIVNPVATNIYREAYIADDLETLKKFVEIELLGLGVEDSDGTKLDALFAKIPEGASFHRTGYLNAKITIGKEDKFIDGTRIYNNPTNWFLRKDILISYEKETQEYEFWAIKDNAKSHTDNFTFTLELDIFFTLNYNFFTLFNGSTMLLGGHWKQNDLSLGSCNFLPDKNDNEKIFDTANPWIIRPDWGQIKDSTGTPIGNTSIEALVLIKSLENTFFFTFFSTASLFNVVDEPGFLTPDGYSYQLYSYLAAIKSKYPDDNGVDIKNIFFQAQGSEVTFNPYEIYSAYFENKIENQASVLGNSFFPLYAMGLNISELIYTNPSESVTPILSWNSTIDLRDSTTDSGLTGGLIKRYDDGNFVIPCIPAQSNYIPVTIPAITKRGLDNPEIPADYLNEVRLQTSECVIYRIYWMDGSNYDIFPEYLVGDITTFYLKETISLQGHTIKLAPVSEGSLVYTGDFKLGYYASMRTPFSLPSNDNAWADYLSQHKATATTGYAIEQGLGRHSLGGALYGNPFNQKSYEYDYDRSYNNWFHPGYKDYYGNYIKPQLERADIISTPNKVDTSGADNFENTLFYNNRALIVKGELTPFEKLVRGQKYFTSGYDNINQLIKLNKDAFNIRYWFEEKKFSNIYEKIKAPLPNEAKDILEKSFLNGIRFWHIRKHPNGNIRYLRIGDFSKNNPDYERAITFKEESTPCVETPSNKL